MKQFPKLKEYSDDELIMIIHEDEGHWQKEAKIYAKKLLEEHGYDENYIQQRAKEIEKEIELFWEQEYAEREVEGYSVVELIVRTIIWPKYVLWDWHLKKEGYYRKRKQRLFTIGLGILIYTLYTAYAVSSYDDLERERIAEIDRIASKDSFAKAQIDWSGVYVFEDSTVQSKEKIVWELDLIKNRGKHSGTLRIGPENKINCVGLVKEDLMEFYPDTTYELQNGFKITYYDMLFAFGRDSLLIFTKWDKLSPIYSEKRKIEDYFKIYNSM